MKSIVVLLTSLIFILCIFNIYVCVCVCVCVCVYLNYSGFIKQGSVSCSWPCSPWGGGGSALCHHTESRAGLREALLKHLPPWLLNQRKELIRLVCRLSGFCLKVTCSIYSRFGEQSTHHTYFFFFLRGLLWYN